MRKEVSVASVWVLIMKRESLCGLHCVGFWSLHQTRNGNYYLLNHNLAISWLSALPKNPARSYADFPPHRFLVGPDRCGPPRRPTVGGGVATHPFLLVVLANSSGEHRITICQDTVSKVVVVSPLGIYPSHRLFLRLRISVNSKVYFLKQNCQTQKEENRQKPTLDWYKVIQKPCPWYINNDQ